MRLVVNATTGVVAINLCGVEFPLRFQIWTTILLIATVFALSVLPLTTGVAGKGVALHDNATPDGSALGALTAVGMGIFLFMGFEWVTPLGRSPKHYERAIPLSMPAAIALLTLAYGLFGLALSLTHTRHQISHSTLPEFLLASTLRAPLGRVLAAALCVLAMVNTFNAGLVGSSRLVYGLSREGSLPAWCATLSLRTGAPFVAVLLAGGIAIAASIAITRFRLTVAAAAYAAAVQCFVYGAVVFAALKLEKTPARSGAFRTPFPRTVQWLVGLLMPVFGLAALFAEPERASLTLGFFAAASLSAVLLGLWLDGRKTRRFRAPSAPSWALAGERENSAPQGNP